MEMGREKIWKSEFNPPSPPPPHPPPTYNLELESIILTLWATSYQPFSYFYWYMTCSKYLAVSYINTKMSTDNEIVVKEV